MATQKDLERAKEVYTDLCAALDRRNWRYGKDEEKNVVFFDVGGEDIPMHFIMAVDERTRLVRLFSTLPFRFDEDKRVIGAIATCAATYGLADGCFEYDLQNGGITYRLSATFSGSTLGDDLFYYLIDCASAVVDEYNDKFLAVSKGIVSIEDFLNQ